MSAFTPCVELSQTEVGKLPGFANIASQQSTPKTSPMGLTASTSRRRFRPVPQTHLKYPVTGFEFQLPYRFSSNVQREPKQEVNQRVDRRQIIIAPTDKIDFVTETHN